LDTETSQPTLSRCSVIPSDSSDQSASKTHHWSLRVSAGPRFFNERSSLSLHSSGPGLFNTGRSPDEAAKEIGTTNKRAGFTYHLGVLRHFDNWEFGAGLSYTTFKQRTISDTIKSLQFYFYESPESIVDYQYNDPVLREKLDNYVAISSLQMLSLPLQVGYNFCSDSRLHVIPQAHLNINFIQQELLDFLPGGIEYFIQTPEYTTSRYELWHVRRYRYNSKITVGAALAVELRYALSKRLYCSGLFSGSYFFGPVDERLPNSQYLSTAAEAMIGFRF
jgi:hypothetical protein